VNIDELHDALGANLEEAIEKLSAKDKITLFINIEEFYRAKMQRTSASPLGEADTVFKIEIVTSEPGSEA